MNNIVVPHVYQKSRHDGSLVRWPNRCIICKTKECEKLFNDGNMGLCSYGYNYITVNKIVLAGFICPDHNSQSKSKSKNLQSDKKQLINLHLIESQAALLRQLEIKKSMLLQEQKSAARDEFLGKESFKDEFLIELKEDILKGLSFVHDYKQINATISQNINVIIETKYSELDFEKKLEKASQQEKAIYWASKFLQEKLNVAKYLLNPDWINRESEKASFRFHGLALKYIKLYEDLFRKKSINLSITGTSHKSVLANPEAVSVIIQTLVDNAYKYSKKSGKAEIHISDQEDHILFSVSSYGPRILDTERELIFLPFKRAKDAIKTQEEGAGYGLYISQLIARRINTIIEVEQEAQLKEKQGHWTTFSINIPFTDWN
ncbi:sensor histidine kinase [Pseudomonas benzopyrenica]|uniref:sensor histidine kinase n=2 Tax=Pseudomonas TaxID=286 RepID=UPI00227F771B|nr:HAMP domain-containing sensor histidine kinase [Pseudomonas benzopyrenica]MDC7828498.1 HAMP domain-containing sensor histidine kinase [Pseudomonas benzopyrenica]